jgi:hypothetical protein
MKQNYSNHVKYYALHHFIFLPLTALLSIVGIFKGITDETNGLVWWLFAILAFCILLLAIMLRQHYALGNQDRIVRLEFRLRYFELFGKGSKEAEENLTFSQIAALRFADDDEFRLLLEKTQKEKLSAREIKQSILNWQGDYMRV